jgi:hypothetical protein
LSLCTKLKEGIAGNTGILEQKTVFAGPCNSCLNITEKEVKLSVKLTKLIIKNKLNIIAITQNSLMAHFKA